MKRLRERNREGRKETIQESQVRRTGRNGCENSRDGRGKTGGTREPKEHRGAAVRRTGKRAERKNRKLSNRKQGKSGRKKAKAERKKEEAEHESGMRKA